MAQKRKSTKTRGKLSDVKSSGGMDPLLTGKHEVIIDKVLDKESKVGNAYFTLVLKDDEGSGVYKDIFMSEAAFFGFKELVSACGYDCDDFEYEADKGQITTIFYKDEEHADADEDGFVVFEMSELEGEQLLATVKVKPNTWKGVTTDRSNVTKLEPTEE